MKIESNWVRAATSWMLGQGRTAEEVVRQLQSKVAGFGLDPSTAAEVARAAEEAKIAHAGATRQKAAREAKARADYARLVAAPGNRDMYVTGSDEDGAPVYSERWTSAGESALAAEGYDGCRTVAHFIARDGK